MAFAHSSRLISHHSVSQIFFSILGHIYSLNKYLVSVQYKMGVEVGSEQEDIAPDFKEFAV